jgi:hypothetical protein
MSEINDGKMSHKTYLELKKSSEPMPMPIADLFLMHPKGCDECLKEAKEQKQKKN